MKALIIPPPSQKQGGDISPPGLTPMLASHVAYWRPFWTFGTTREYSHTLPDYGLAPAGEFTSNDTFTQYLIYRKPMPHIILQLHIEFPFWWHIVSEGLQQLLAAECEWLFSPFIIFLLFKFFLLIPHFFPFLAGMPGARAPMSPCKFCSARYGPHLCCSALISVWTLAHFPIIDLNSRWYLF